jgi:hypothetical protein
MLVEGACAEGHDLVCVIQRAHVSGVLVRGTLRDACPVCGGKPYVILESATLPSSAKIPSEPPGALEAKEPKQGRR